MNEQEKELAVKIFDHFFKKAMVDTISIPWISTETKLIWFSVHIQRMECSSFFVTNDIVLDIEKDILIDYIDKKFLLKDFPKDLKTRIVHACVSSDQQLVIPLFETIVLIPEARSLEELAIKMELES